MEGKLLTLEDIEKEFYNLHEDGNFLNAIYRSREVAENQMIHICKKMNINPDDIGKGFYNDGKIFSYHFEHIDADDKYQLSTALLVAWIKYFFNLEEK